jgi:glucose/mannose-6-phosphate isomerase
MSGKANSSLTNRGRKINFCSDKIDSIAKTQLQQTLFFSMTYSRYILILKKGEPMKTLILLGLVMMQTEAITTLVTSPLPTIDTENMFNAIYSFPEQVEQALQIGKRITLTRSYDDIDHILFAGMGGSAMAGDITKALVKEICKKPITIIKNYTLPSWANERTLVICVSYSGNTEETLTCFEQAHQRNLPIIGLCTGGTLLEKLLSSDYDYIIVPGGLQPRAALGYLTIPLVYLLYKLNYVDSNIIRELELVPVHLKNYRETFAAQDPKNPAYLYAQNLRQFMPVIFAEADTTDCIAQRWAAQLAENSKMVSRTKTLPELNHNEIVGWYNNAHILKSSVVIWLLDRSMHERNRKRVDITKELLQGLPAVQLQFEGSGATWSHRLFYLIYFGDWISYWCAIAHETDPTTIVAIDTLKKRMRD